MCICLCVCAWLFLTTCGYMYWYTKELRVYESAFLLVDLNVCIIVFVLSTISGISNLQLISVITFLYVLYLILIAPPFIEDFLCLYAKTWLYIYSYVCGCVWGCMYVFACVCMYMFVRLSVKIDICISPLNFIHSP